MRKEVLLGLVVYGLVSVLFIAVLAQSYDTFLIESCNHKQVEEE